MGQAGYFSSSALSLVRIALPPQRPRAGSTRAFFRRQKQGPAGGNAGPRQAPEGATVGVEKSRVPNVKANI
jgi:hypothetical protein